jgi:hypothetical protein
MKKHFLILYFLIISCSALNSQSNWDISTGIGLPDNLSNKYLKPGLYFSYGIEYSLAKRLLIKPSLSIAYNNKNESYRFGFDDEPNFLNDPVNKEIQEDIRSLTNYYGSLQIYLFNPSLDISTKYLVIDKQKISIYALAGASINYSFIQDPIETFHFDNNGKYTGSEFDPNDKENILNLGFSGGIGFSYKFRNSNALFIETQYKLQPWVKYGRYNDRTGLIYINIGYSTPFRKRA